MGSDRVGPEGEASRPREIAVPLADGFEETEAVAVVDVLRRAGLKVTTLALGPGPVTGSHGIALVPDAVIDEVDLRGFDAVVLPGGMPGTVNLMGDRRVLGLVQRLASDGRPVAAICAAPRVLAAAGVVEGLDVTSHPSVREMLPGATVVDAPRVVVAHREGGGAVLTSQGPGTALEFGLELVRQWVSAERAEELREAMLVVPS